VSNGNGGDNGDFPHFRLSPCALAASSRLPSLELIARPSIAYCFAGGTKDPTPREWTRVVDGLVVTDVRGEQHTVRVRRVRDRDAFVLASQLLDDCTSAVLYATVVDVRRCR
jgi:hypothetical protein